MKEGFKKSWISSLYSESNTQPSFVICLMHDSKILESHLKLKIPFNEDLLRLLSSGALSIVHQYDDGRLPRTRRQNAGNCDHVAECSHISGVFDYSNAWDDENVHSVSRSFSEGRHKNWDDSMLYKAYHLVQVSYFKTASKSGLWYTIRTLIYNVLGKKKKKKTKKKMIHNFNM